jgi:hypothetical protein
VYARQHVDFFVLLVKQVFELPHFGFESSNAIFQGLCVTSWKCSSAQLVAGLAFKADIGALCTGWSNAVTSNLLASAPIACLRNPTLRTASHPNHLHRQDAGHDGEYVEKDL